MEMNDLEFTWEMSIGTNGIDMDIVTPLAYPTKTYLDIEPTPLSFYDGYANIADIEDLRQLLGIEEWNVFGMSYGARIALLLMQEYPETIRSGVIDSIIPYTFPNMSCVIEVETELFNFEQ